MLISAAVPMIMGGVMVFITRQWLYSLFMLMTPVMVLGNWLGGSKQRGGSHRRKLRAYTAELAEAETKLEQAKAADEKRRREDAMDPAQVLLTATGPRRRLWERRATDPDTLQLRVGLFDRPALIELVGPRPPACPRCRVRSACPVSLPLAELGVVGLSGPRDASRALARWLVAQAAALHSPRDLAIIVLSADPAAGPHWNWVRWLPHCAPREGEDCVALIGADPDTVARRVTELAIRITERRRAAEPAGAFAGAGSAAARRGVQHPAGPGRRPAAPPGARHAAGAFAVPQVGLHAICIDDDERLLPEECTAVAMWDWDRPDPRYGCAATGSTRSARCWPTRCPPAWCGNGRARPRRTPRCSRRSATADRLARALAPGGDVLRDDAIDDPREARLLADPRCRSVASGCRRPGSGGRTTSVPIGVAADGVFSVDLRLDGPHGLIAGTTGAGKSELLQTMIASLAVANRPDEMTFVLIDYKGGAAFKDCASLPHVVGMVTDLDGHLTERALKSLGAELRRREEILLHAGAKDIEDYCDMFDAGDRRASIACPGWSWSSTSSPRWWASCPTSWRGSSTSADAAGHWACTCCSPPSGPPASSPATSAPTPTCGSRCASPTPTSPPT